jgi:bifunctional non-homologous end joining protein LigD
VSRQELVIGGFTDPEGTRQGLGALLVGHYGPDGHLVYAGKVGTGFTVKGASELRSRLDALEVTACPFTPQPPGVIAKRAHWVRPELVCEVAFTEWTTDGRIRHPAFHGLRADRDPRTVVREEFAIRPSNRTPRAAASATGRRPSGVQVAGVTISHPERVVYPDDGVTKLEVAQYYARVHEWMLPHLADRPLTLVRCPAGLESCFYMKHTNMSPPRGTRRALIPEKRKVGEYLVVETASGLIALAQFGVLEIHTWNSTETALEAPDRIVFDIDPGERVGWSDVVEAARLVRRLLNGAGLESFPKTTGGRGLHVVVPLEPVVHDGMPCLQLCAPARGPRWSARIPAAVYDVVSQGRTRAQAAHRLPPEQPGRARRLPPTRRGRVRARRSPCPSAGRDAHAIALDPATFTLRTRAASGSRRRRADPWAGYLAGAAAAALFPRCRSERTPADPRAAASLELPLPAGT